MWARSRLPASKAASTSSFACRPWSPGRSERLASESRNQGRNGPKLPDMGAPIKLTNRDFSAHFSGPSNFDLNGDNKTPSSEAAVFNLVRLQQHPEETPYDC